ncbi:thiol:disulfide interchange protein DsbA/DsbL [Pasteurella bettyae]|uniref:Thiol:disulfide interchange protein DsbA n=1 Tax=Pasteurella bettyae CCUG 2042 TaxID=1095749 RepID=I3DCN8_9PAST|nr:thiol:disulfide interchange protein DsbA/DsbL [Pasteurella bettyae]EIJ69481.1 hypothetical protein HMPREF1052_0920 [Pasteurella bettyae CCUG 2042]SUB21391.1 thioredoxin fold protein [Pasteurella bettyae]
MKICRYLPMLLGVHSVFAQDNSVTPSMPQDISVAETRVAENQFEDGRDYFSYNSPIKGENPIDHKILIQSFFDYDCRVCVNTQDILELYSRINPNKVVIVEHPIATKETPYTARVYYSLKRLNHSDIADALLFETADPERYQALTNLDNLVAYLQEQQVDGQAFMDTYNSTEIQKQVNEAIYRTEKYGVFTYPFVVIQGRYVLTNSTLYNDDYTFAVLDYLVGKLSKNENLQ